MKSPANVSLISFDHILCCFLVVWSVFVYYSLVKFPEHINSFFHDWYRFVAKVCMRYNLFG